MKSVIVNNVSKHYGKKKDTVQALKGISFEVGGVTVAGCKQYNDGNGPYYNHLVHEHLF